MSVAVTGVSGFLGQRLLPLLDASPDVDRVVGLDVRDPARRARSLDFHRVDIASGEVAPFLRGVDAVVHLAAIASPIMDEDLMTRVNAGGTRRLLAAATEAGVGVFVRPSSAAVYGAWANNAVPLTEDAPVRPNAGFLPATIDAECERMIDEWRRDGSGRRAVRLRVAPTLGPGAQSLFAGAVAGRLSVHLRNAAPPVQAVHVDDVAGALALAATGDLDGVFNVSADGWLAHDEWLALVGRPLVPALPYEAAERMLKALWASGLAEVPPSALPYLAHPWVIANDRLEAKGWTPRHTNEEAILLATPAARRGALPWVAAVAAVLVGVTGATWWLRRRRR